MRRLTDEDLNRIIGTIQSGYTIECARIECGTFTDSDHYGILLGRNEKGQYVTWQFHLLEDDELSVYWGHYMENRETAIHDYDTRDLDSKLFKVTITETSKMVVEVEAKDRQEAEQIVSDNWRNSEYILDADNFIGVEFNAVPIVQVDSTHTN